MRVCLNWKFLANFSGLNECFKHIESLNIQWTTKKSNKNKCTLCFNDDHDMMVKYLNCVCNLEMCSMRFLVNACTINNNCTLYVLDQHEFPSDDEKDDAIERRGISCFVKELIEEGMYTKNIRKPKKIEIFLKAHTKLQHKQHMIPHLKKIQHFIKYRRVQLGDLNNLDGLYEHVFGNLIENLDGEKLDQFADDEPIYFGYNKDGNGSDENHFNLCVTSRALMSNILHGSIFHLDCTYKIVKYNYPLLIFGVTDIRRKFRPVAFAFLSHEQEPDFSNFFTNLNVVAERIGTFYSLIYKLIVY